MISHISHLECPQCRRKHSADSLTTFCVCGSTLFAKYDINSIQEEIESGGFPSDLNSMWRYSQLLPVKSPSYIISLGEGWTPLLLSRQLGKHMGLRMLRIKDEAQNPTGSFKDRGLSVAVSKNLEFDFPGTCGKSDPSQGVPVYAGGGQIRFRKIRLGGVG